MSALRGNLVSNFGGSRWPGLIFCYIGNLSRKEAHDPNWSITRSLDSIIDEMLATELVSGAPSR